MQVVLSKAVESDKKIIQNLAAFYIYDMSRYCGFFPGFETPPDGHFSCFDLSHYWKEPNRYPFLIRVGKELAGFVLIHTNGGRKEVNWVMGEFFIVAKFQRRGVGKEIAFTIFRQFPGFWEIAQITENKPAICFWEKVIEEYAGGIFEKIERAAGEIAKYPMVVMYFVAP